MDVREGYGDHHRQCLRCPEPATPSGRYCDSCNRDVLSEFDPDSGWLKPCGEFELDSIEQQQQHFDEYWQLLHQRAIEDED